MESNTPSTRIQFDPFELDLSSGELYKRGRKVRLERLPFQVLATLVEQPGLVVTREQLQRKLWASDTFVDFEAGLNTAIGKLREALGDSRAHSRFVETLPRRGYRFIGAVQRASNGKPLTEVGTPGAASPPTSAPLVSRWRTVSAAGLVVALVAAALGTWSVAGRRQRLPQVVNPKRIQTIAVLPFKSLTGANDPALELGLADALITKLSNSRELVVRPTASVLKYTAADGDPVAAGRELKVDSVLDGSVQRMDDRVRVTVPLLSVQDGSPLWGQEFDELWTQILTVQDSISERVVRALTIELTGDERERLTKRDTESLEAYEAYLLGRYHWNRRNADGIQEARDYFERAIALDPGYALAYSGLADSYVMFPAVIGGQPRELFGKARAAALKATQIDDTAAEPHASLAFILVHYDFDWSGAEREFKRAFELNPNYATAHQWYGASYLSLIGKHAEAIAEAKRAQELDPLSPVISRDIGRAYYYAREYDHAIEQYRKPLNELRISCRYASF
jgi:TolB-like protein/DNA-binding winged helix-turn-helix (wHTH) protein/Tfp pilus assembly protein PilF